MNKLLILILMPLAIFGRAYGGPNSDAIVSLDLVVAENRNKVDDRIISGNVSGTGGEIQIEVFITNTKTAITGIEIAFDIDESILELGISSKSKKFDFIIQKGTAIWLAALGRFYLDDPGYVATASFKVIADVTNKEFSIGIKEVTIAEGAGLSETIHSTAKVFFNSSIPIPPAPIPRTLLQATQDSLNMAKQGDINFDGIVNFADFLILTQNFNKTTN